jgi:hypothetical protein
VAGAELAQASGSTGREPGGWLRYRSSVSHFVAGATSSIVIVLGPASSGTVGCFGMRPKNGGTAVLASSSLIGGIVEEQQGRADLLEVIEAGGAAGAGPGALHRWQEQADERADDGNHHEKLDERETATLLHTLTY